VAPPPTPKPKEEPRAQENLSSLDKKDEYSDMSEEAKRVFAMMPIGEAVPLDLFEELELSPSELTRILFGLELSGAISSAPGGNYIRRK
jgi:predicted Rossmann fold nucleotide-binding protein DprA/Smf involved in DNA uptake